MKMVVQVKLLPTVVQAAALAETLNACNAAANQVSRVAFDTGRARNLRRQLQRKRTKAVPQHRSPGGCCAGCGAAVIRPCTRPLTGDGCWMRQATRQPAGP